MREFDPEELASFDGTDGKPVYVAFQGKVFDVSGSKLWKGGLHMRRHHAGKDLTTDLKAAPHGVEMLEKHPQVGVLKVRQEIETNAPQILLRLLARYPFLRRHPHPMTVHFPIAFSFSSAFFTILYMITSVPSFETTALHCLAAGILFTPVVILTGLVSWWLNYLAKPLRAIKIKLTASLSLFVVSLVLFGWRMTVPDILSSFRIASLLYLFLILSLIPLITVIGWFGANLTFPIEDE